MLTHTETFRAAYLEKLSWQVKHHPEQYAYAEDEIPRVVEKMLKALAEGTANVGAAASGAAKKCGIKPTIKAIKEYLNT